LKLQEKDIFLLKEQLYIGFVILILLIEILVRLKNGSKNFSPIIDRAVLTMNLNALMECYKSPDSSMWEKLFVDPTSQ